MSDYKQKYRKYKSKYLASKRLEQHVIEGAIPDDDSNVKIGKEPSKYKGGDFNDFLKLLKAKKTKTVVVADGITYPNNAGTIVRNGSILGSDMTVFCKLDKERFDKMPEQSAKSVSEYEGDIIYNHDFRKNTIRFSMMKKHNEKFNVFFNFEIKDVMDAALENDYKIFMLENYEKADIYNIDMSQDKVMFIVGNEREGVSEIVQKYRKDGKISPVFIPSCLKGASSFNVANAATIAVYERNRQNRCEMDLSGGNILF